MIGITRDLNKTPWPQQAIAMTDPALRADVVKVGRMEQGINGTTTAVVIHAVTETGESIIVRAPLASFTVAMNALQSP